MKVFKKAITFYLRANHKDLVKKVYERVWKVYDVPREFNGLNEFYSHHRSIEEKRSLLNNKLIPWITYPAFEFLNSLDLKGKKVFEWGAGSSSIFLSREKGCFVESTEHSKEWFEEVKRHESEKLKINFVPLDSYAQYIQKKEGKYDLIIIDGERRKDCARNILGKLSAGGMILLDNSDWFEETCSLIRASFDVIQIDFHGFSPINRYTSTTTIFFDRSYVSNYQGRCPAYSQGARILKESQIP